MPKRLYENTMSILEAEMATFMERMEMEIKGFIGRVSHSAQACRLDELATMRSLRNAVIEVGNLSIKTGMELNAKVQRLKKAKGERNEKIF